ncbi:MAG: hypothetical protein JXQ83_13860 [Candidatus Glassbacteria bacterium]|nr:hypothetical protein [Candidatus Glassbacteria bacterium]
MNSSIWTSQPDEHTESSDDYGYNYWGYDPVWRGFSVGGVRREVGDKTLTFSYAYRNKGRLIADNFFTLTFGF